MLMLTFSGTRLLESLLSTHYQRPSNLLWRLPHHRRPRDSLSQPSIKSAPSPESALERLLISH